MSADLVSKFVRAFYATDRTDTRAEGICISYCDAPTITIQTISGEHVHWRADLSEPADEFAELRADMDRSIEHLKNEVNRQVRTSDWATPVPPQIWIADVTSDSPSPELEEAGEGEVGRRERRAREDERERIAVAIEDAALHVMTTVKSHEGAALTAAILERAATIARSQP